MGGGQKPQDCKQVAGEWEVKLGPEGSGLMGPDGGGTGTDPIPVPQHSATVQNLLDLCHPNQWCRCYPG